MLKSATTNDLIFQAKRKGITVVKPFPKIFSRRSIYMENTNKQIQKSTMISHCIFYEYPIRLTISLLLSFYMVTEDDYFSS